MKKTGKKFLKAFILLALFLLYTAAVRTIDVQPIGPEGTSVGFARVNDFVRGLLGTRDNMKEPWYIITNYTAYFSIFCGLLFALAGLLQWISRKNLFKVDYRILILGCFLIMLGMLYVLFMKVVVNYRPVIVDPEEWPESSFPSSHTLLSVSIMSMLGLTLPGATKNKALAPILRVVSIVVIILMTVGRMLSGVHWFSDIVGGVLLSLALAAFYSAFVYMVGRNIRRKKKKTRKA